MKEQLKLLYELQALEQKKMRLVNQKSNIDAGEVRHLWQEICLITQDVATIREKRECLEKVCTRQQDDLTEITKQCEADENKLYSGNITKLKELEERKTKCEAKRREIAGFENEILNNMEFCDKLLADINEQEEILAKKRQEHGLGQQELVKQLAHFEQQLSELETSCRSLEKQVDNKLLLRFRDLARRLPNPVAKVENNVCSACRVSIPSSQLSRGGSELLYCEHCGRLLLVD